MLTSEQKQAFARDGFLHLHGVIPREKIDQALVHINHWLGNEFDPTQVEVYRQQSYCPAIREEPIVTGMVSETEVYSMAEELTAPGALHPVKQGQIALRFPDPRRAAKQPGGHIDGIPNGRNGVPPGTIYSFTTLVGIPLSTVDRDFAGNFCVWPGSHLKLEKWFKTQQLTDLLETGLPKLDYGPPKQVHWEPGDVLFAHHQTVHGIAPNLSPNIRYACFYRLHHVKHEEIREEVVRDIWREYNGVREVVGA